MQNIQRGTFPSNLLPDYSEMMSQPVRHQAVRREVIALWRTSRRDGQSMVTLALSCGHQITQAWFTAIYDAQMRAPRALHAECPHCAAPEYAVRYFRQEIVGS